MEWDVSSSGYEKTFLLGKGKVDEANMNSSEY